MEMSLLKEEITRLLDLALILSDKGKVSVSDCE
jgi:hypothetical protein